MSSYGVAVVVDVHGDGSLDEVLDGVAALEGASWMAPVAGPWQRVAACFGEIEKVEMVTDWVAHAGLARAAIAEDYDEYGALWVVLANDGEGVRTVHRRYVLNADPNDPDDVALTLTDFNGIDPRQNDVAGPEAAAAAAAVFDVNPAAMLAAEAASDTAHEQIGVVGGPFPWWGALQLPWPQPGAGEQVHR
jgi:hypothetical protein